MHRLVPVVLIALLLGGCGTTPTDSESTREVVLQYLGGDVGTAGPYSGPVAKKELDVLTPDDRRRAEKLVDEGAAAVVVYGSNAAAASARSAGGATRIVLIQKGKIVGDFASAPKASPAPAP